MSGWRLGAALACGVFPGAASAQTDYYNLDAGRPIQIEDAYPVERYAFELDLAPLRVERARGGSYRWGIEPELTYGILPRTHLKIGAPLASIVVVGGARRTGLAGIDISVLHNLTAETRTLPALGVLADVVVPAGPLGPERSYASVKGLATRTYRFARFHANAQRTLGRAPSEPAAPLTDGPVGTGAAEVSRWMAGAAVDKAFPLKSMLVAGELFARRPIGRGEAVEWNAGTGIRYQVSPSWAVDGGLGRRLSGSDPAWYATFGTAYAFAVRSLIPIRSR